MANALGEAAREFRGSDNDMLTATGHMPGQLWMNVDAQLGSRDSRKIDNHTYLQRRPEGAIAVKLHATDVVTYKKDGSVVLDSGGWQTPTTKDRINSNQGLGRITQKNRQWTVEAFGKEYPFQDGMSLGPGTRVMGAGKPSDTAKLKKTKKSIDSYSDAYVDALFAGKVPAPAAGDCFHCSLHQETTGKPLGELVSDSEHLESHMKEKYYVPSLLMNAIKDVPVSIAARQTLTDIWSDPEGEHAAERSGGMDDIAKEQLKKSLKRYMYRMEGLSR